MDKWWQSSVFYQIYPRSFQDSDGDGYGDIPGIISRLDEIQKLGVGAIWLSPVYRSPGADNGYDISDYKDIDPMFGTLDDMDRLIAEAKKRGIRIVMDLVINHTSDEHMWFKKSRAGDEKYKDYYIWRPAAPGGGPPGNWTGFFMGSAWEWDTQRGEYYLHLFDKKQPDLNYHNPAVIEEVKGILRFWLDRGVAGFRCDVINVLYKTTLADGKPSLAICGLEHYKTQEGNHRILRSLREDVLDKYDAFTVGETVMVDLEEGKLLSDESRKELDMIFYFDHLEVDRRIARYIPKKFKASKLLDRLTKWQQGLDHNAVYLENHDQPRIVSHYGDDAAYHDESAKLLATMQLTLCGTVFIYQGQEIGMTNFDYEHLYELDDVESKNIDGLMKRLHIPKRLRWHWIKTASRDNARTPMQWTAGSESGAGFTTGRPWLAINSNADRINYEDQVKDPDSVLNYYKELIKLRASSETLRSGSFTPLYSDNSVMSYVRRPQTSAGTQPGEDISDKEYLIILNFSPKPQEMPAPIRALGGEIIISNTGRAGELPEVIEPWGALVVGIDLKLYD
jgi:oligo-1,6-glucosidase